jgi:hypothetical protein
VRILFILKLGFYQYGSYGGSSPSGLLNSAQFIVDMLNANGQTAELVQLIDNNGIDKAVHDFKPDIAIIEALWVVPTKFEILTKLHPKVKWVVRGHSDLPFLAQEGIAIDWLFDYLNYENVSIAFNDARMVEEFEYLVARPSRVLYLPNYYPIVFTPSLARSVDPFRVGCFGAIRPLKNQLLQAMAAILYAEESNQKLEFHINSTRVEDGTGILKNVRALFAHTGHTLVEHPWLTHKQFLTLVATMNVVLAVSLSETFCITAADAVAQGVPLICSSQIPWADHASIVPDTDVNAIIDRIYDVTNNLFPVQRNQQNLRRYSDKARQIWLRYLS